MPLARSTNRATSRTGTRGGANGFRASLTAGGMAVSSPTQRTISRTTAEGPVVPAGLICRLAELRVPLFGVVDAIHRQEGLHLSVGGTPGWRRSCGAAW